MGILTIINSISLIVILVGLIILIWKHIALKRRFEEFQQVTFESLESVYQRLLSLSLADASLLSTIKNMANMIAALEPGNPIPFPEVADELTEDDGRDEYFLGEIL